MRPCRGGSNGPSSGRWPLMAAVRGLTCRDRRRVSQADIEQVVEMRRDAYTRASRGHRDAPARSPPRHPADDPLAPFSPAVRDWFEARFEAPTEAQARGLGGDRRRPATR